jgi:DNA-3-methyladenine glycosylase
VEQSAQPPRAERLSRTLPRSFYRRDARELAPLLLNKLLVRVEPGEPRLTARIVEVEAYCGSEDPASHAFRGPTKRNATMFGPPGRLYVYFTYGMHWCANVVGHATGDASAVLVRAAAPVDGVELMRTRRVKARRDRELCAGPARLCQAFGLTGAFDGIDLTRGEVRIIDDGVPPPRPPVVTTRVGLRAGEGDESPWRFLVPGDPNISRGPRSVDG